MEDSTDIMKTQEVPFQKGEYTICGNNGVCQITDCTTLDITGIDKDRKYYILKPVYTASSTVYIPENTAQKSMRRVLSKTEAEKLMDSIPEIPLVQAMNEKAMEAKYWESMGSNESIEWLRLLKTTYARKKERMESGRKVIALDSKFLKLAGEALYGELSVVLDIPREEIESSIMNTLEKL